jgi:hypothetical protein
MPFDLIVLEDKSVGADYRARVGINKSAVSAVGGNYASFIAEAIARTGMLPATVRMVGSDYLPHEMTNPTGILAKPVAPISGYTNITDVSTLTSCAYFGTAAKGHYYTSAMASAALTGSKWAYFYRYKSTTATAANFQVILEICRQSGGTSEGCCIGIGGVADSTGSVYIYWATTGISLILVGTYPVTDKTLLHTFDQNWHSGVVWSSGDGMFHCLQDSLAQIDVTMGAGAVATEPYLAASCKNCLLDYNVLVSGT